jgi:sensor histidine kinase regulating citrate/malate metabolism
MIIVLMLRGSMRAVMVTSFVAVVILLIGYQIYTDRLPWNSIFDTAIHLIVILVAMAVLVVVYSNTYMQEKQRSEAYARTIEENVHQQLYYVENLEQLIGRLKSERHDFNNHLSVIHGLLESGEADKAKNYVALLVENAVEYQSIVNIPYPALRALLNHKLSAAREARIKLRLNVGLPEGLSINEFELAAILGNLLDNAMEACALLMDVKPYIELTLKYQPDYLVVHVANPFTAVPEGKRRPEKPNPENHGFGLKNVQHLVGKHNSLLEIKQKDGVFEVDIALLVE